MPSESMRSTRSIFGRAKREKTLRLSVKGRLQGEVGGDVRDVERYIGDVEEYAGDVEGYAGGDVERFVGGDVEGKLLCRYVSKA